LRVIARKKHQGLQETHSLGKENMPRPKRDILAAAQAATEPPETLPEDHFIAKVVKAQRSSVYLLALPGGKEVLAQLGAKLRNTFWLKRNNFVVVNGSALADRDNKLAGEICTVILEDKKWRNMSWWPAEFVKSNAYQFEDDEDSNVGKLPPSYSDEEEGVEEEET
jgi:probable RNA-binding protein EIF1AD